MMENNVTVLLQLSSQELLEQLKESWGYSFDKPLEVIADLTYHHDLNNQPFYKLENLVHTETEERLKNPITGYDATVYISGQNYLLNKEHIELANKKVICSPTISSAKERNKHENPFLLSVKASDLNILTEAPKEITAEALITLEGQKFLEKWVIDSYRERNESVLYSEHQRLKDALEVERETELQYVDMLKLEHEKLELEKSDLEKNIEDNQKKLSDTSERIDKLEREYYVQKTTLEQSLMSLKDLIEKRTDSLLKLELLTEEELNSLLGTVDESEALEGYSFTDFFEEDFDKVITYIQAYLYQKGIVYRRGVLLDFLALLMSNDLIILAGDSGSGKTHLVKSFADAIGGKSVIIPVKPNWTSAEDLLGYYNPLENKYLSTPFLDAIIEASKNPQTPYLICLDEMNLARVEYYFADFLSLLEERTEVPEIPLYSDTESELLATEVKNFISLIDEAKLQTNSLDLMSFLDILKDEELNRKLHELCGFKEGDSLLKYHVRLRRMMSSYLGIPSKIKMPENVRIIGAINVDETTHYLSPKILDRAHIMKFSSPLLMDWSEIETEIETFPYAVDRPVIFPPHILNDRKAYPNFDREDELVQTLVSLVQEYLDPLGVEFGLRTIRQALNYRNLLKNYEELTDGLILNQIVLHKILPKMMFDGNRALLGGYRNEGVLRKDHLAKMLDHLNVLLGDESFEGYDSCLVEFRTLVDNAVANDGVVNYWTR